MRFGPLCVWFMAGYGGLGLSIEGPSKVDINCEDVEDGTCKVTYCPTEPGNYIINIKFADQHVPGRKAWRHLVKVSKDFGSLNGT